jgi:hypothetical protein
MRAQYITALLLLCAAGCSRGGPVAEAEAAAVYESLLYAHCCVDSAIVQAVTDSARLANPTAVQALLKGVQHFSPEIREAVADLHARSASVSPLPDSVHVSGHDQRVSADSARALLHRIYRDHLDRLPNRATIVQLSAVGYSRNGEVAVVRMVQTCGSLCGGITLRALRKHPTGWVAAEEVWSAVF